MAVIENKINKQDWLFIVKKYNKPNIFRSYLELVISFSLFFSLWYLSYKTLVENYSYGITLSLCFLTSLFLARIFVIQHDCGHGSFLRSKKQRDIIGYICGVFTLTAYSCWARIHNIHHKETGNLDNRKIGDFAMMTVKEYESSSKLNKFIYKVNRNPFALILLVPFLVFFIFNRLPATQKEFFFRKVHKRSVLFNNLGILTIIVFMGSLIGYKNFFLIQFPISLIVSTIGIYLFYLQHQFEDTYWESKKELDFFKQAMQGSSYIIMPFYLEWLLLNVNYHHIHHLCPTIPGYNLKKCYKENKIFHDVPTINFWNSYKTLNLSLWDEKNKKLISFKDLKTRK